MARFPSSWGKSIDTPEVSPASTPRAPVPLQSLSKLSIPMTTPSKFGQFANYFSGGQSSSSTAASPRSIISTEYSSLNHSTCTSPHCSKSKDVATRFPFSTDSFRAKHCEQSWTSLNRTGYAPRRGTISRCTGGSLKLNVASGTSPSSTISLNSASVATRWSVTNGDVSERPMVNRLSFGSRELLKSQDELNGSWKSSNPLGRRTITPLTSNTSSSPSYELSPHTELHDSRPFSSVRSGQSGENKEIVCLPRGKVLLARDQKPILRSDLSFRDCGVLIGPDSMMIFDEEGHPFTKRKLVMAADGKPSLDEHHRLQKLEYEKVVQGDLSEKRVTNKLSCSNKFIPIRGQERHGVSLDGSGCFLSGRDCLPVSKSGVERTEEQHGLTKKLEHGQVVREEAVEEKVNDPLVCSEKLFPASGHERHRISLDGSGCILAGRDCLPVTKGGADGTEEHHRLTRREAAGERMNDLSVCSEKMLPVSRQGRPLGILPDRTFPDASGSFVSSSNSLPVSKDEVILGASVDSVLALLDGPEWVAMMQKSE